MLYHYFPSPTADDGASRANTDGRRPPYLLAFSDDRALPRPQRQTLVRARDGAEMANLVALLGEACAIAHSEPFRQTQPALADEARRLAEQPPRLTFPLDVTALRETLRRLPLALPGLVNTGLALDDDDPLPGPIDRRYVHKKRPLTS